MSVNQPPSPLDSIPDLETVPQEKVKELENYFNENTVPKVRKKIIEDHNSAVVLRRAVLGKIRV